mgnify:CR=1 FL=1
MKLGLANPNASKNTYISWMGGDMLLVGEYSSCWGVKECNAHVGIEKWGKKFLTLSRTKMFTNEANVV